MINFSLLPRQLGLWMLLGLSSLMASTLPAAKEANKVCEQPDGYVRAIVNDPDINTLVATVNQKRRTEYQGIAQSKGTDLTIVGQIASQEIAQRHPNHVCR